MTAGRNLTAMVASRICHDLISPIGAIGNGLELLALSSGPTPEMTLISESVAQAQARIRLFRLAFGAANGQVMPRRDVQALMKELSQGGRVAYAWAVEEDRAREEVRAALLAMLCVEAALPRGGRIEVRLAGGRWEVAGSGPAMRADPLAYGVLDGSSDGATITPAGIQFLLLPQALEPLGRRAVVESPGPDAMTLSF